MNVERTLLKFLVWPLHRATLRLTAGRVGVAEPGRRIGTLVLTTTGRRSGEQRSVPVYFARDSERLVLVASNAGDDRDPTWYLNLQATPRVAARTPRGTGEFNARDATAEERERLWPTLVRLNPAYRRYERRTERPIPIVVLEPAGGS